MKVRFECEGIDLNRIAVGRTVSRVEETGSGIYLHFVGGGALAFYHKPPHPLRKWAERLWDEVGLAAVMVAGTLGGMAAVWALIEMYRRITP